MINIKIVYDSYYNDYDVFITRDEDTKTTEKHSFGNLFDAETYIKTFIDVEASKTVPVREINVSPEYLTQRGEEIKKEVMKKSSLDLTEKPSKTKEKLTVWQRIVNKFCNAKGLK